MRGITAQYYQAIRSVLKEKPHLRKCLTRCRHCQILFFTHPRNAGRSDLGCPFGCREAHRRRNAKCRSTEYYKSPEGKEKKKRLNAARGQQDRFSEPSADKKGNVDDATVVHIQLVTSLVEGRWVDIAEIFTMLDKILRQHSIDATVKSSYDGLHHQNNPP